MKIFKEKATEALFLSSTLFSMLMTLAIFGFMVVLGLPAFREGGYLHLLSSMWDPGTGGFGILPMLHGTLWISCLSLLFAIPLSLGCSALICTLSKGMMARVLSTTVRMMTGIPTVIYGFVGVFLIIPFVRTWISGGSGFSIFSAALMLSLMVSPTLILFFSDSFHAAERLHGRGADALGCSRVQKFLYVILPASVPGMITGIILAAGRALGDTLIALMLAGNAVAIPGSPFDPARTLTSHIALIIAADYESLEFKSIFACGITLYLIQSCLTALAYGVRIHKAKKASGSDSLFFYPKTWAHALARRTPVGYFEGATRFLEQLFLPFSWCCGLFLLGSILGLTGYLLYHGLPGLSLELIFGDADPIPALFLKQRVFDGLLPAIFGTVFLVALSVLAAVPPGIFTGIYLAEYAGPRFKAMAGLFVDILAGIPSIVVGLFGFSLSLFLHKSVSDKIYPCLFFSALSLAALILPYIVRTTQSALEGIPGELRQTALALGATRLQNITHVLLPEAIPGILSGVVLAVGRCAEDTAVIMLTGVVASAGIPRSLFDHFEALPFYIYYISSEYTSQGELQTGYSAALILLVICGLLFTLSFWIKHRILREYKNP